MFRFFFLFLVLDGFCGRHIVKIGNGMLVCQLAVHPDVKPEDDRNEDRCKQTDLEHSARAVEIEDGTDECDDIKKYQSGDSDDRQNTLLFGIHITESFLSISGSIKTE